ncbi:MAG TPA: copper-binding protein [Thermodesulfobacteriota bacterium]
MKVITIFSLITIIFALTISYTQSNQFVELKTKQIQISKDIPKLKQEIAKSDWPKYYDATGVLKSVSENQIVVDEDEIPGFMSAMIMSYEVEKPIQLKGLEKGDKVKFKLKETENGLVTVVDIRKQK